MKKQSFIKTVLAAVAFIAVFLLFGSVAAAPQSDLAGHWEGAIVLPTGSLGVQVDLGLEENQSWRGTIDIPAQGLHAYKLNPVEGNGVAIQFAMPGVPGDPRFSGRLAGDGKTIAGDFMQSGQKFPFQLERKAKPVAARSPTPAPGIPGKGLAGHWLGSLVVAPGVELRLTWEIRITAAGKPQGEMVSVDQGNARIPISALSEKNGVVHLEASSIGATFEGKFNADGSEIAGDWKQGAQSIPISFKRLAQAPSFSFNRPQEPKKPYPYREEEVVVENKTAGVKLAGTLTLSSDPGPHSAVVLITGSGPQDRDETVFNHRPFLVVADHLTRQGIAVLRYDDRGVGKSSGDFAQATNADFVEDALAAVAYLRARKEIDSARVGLVGHSEGGTVAARAAIRSSDVAYIVLLAGVGLPLEEVLLRQGRDLGRAAGSSEKELATEAAIQRDIFRIVKTEADPAAAKTALRNSIHQKIAALTNKERAVAGVSEAMIEGQIEAVLSPWFREMLAYDPRPTLKAVRCPVLALDGEKDLQVNAEENLAAVRDALRAGGNHNVRTVQLPGLNHLFQKCVTGSLAEYEQIEQTFDPGALQLVSDWICGRGRHDGLASIAPHLLKEKSR